MVIDRSSFSEKQEVKKFDRALHNLKQKAAELSDTNDLSNKKHAREVMNLAQELKALVGKAKNKFIVNNKEKNPLLFQNLIDKISVQEQKAINVFSRIVGPELALLAAKNDGILDKELKLLDSIKVNDQVRGLKNRGQTCFMNSVLQSLFRTSELNRLLQVALEKIPLAEGVSKENSVLKILHETFNDYIDGASAKDYINPKNLVNLRPFYFPSFKIGEQGDAHEFFTKFIERLDQELSVASSPKFVISDEFRGNFNYIENYNKAGALGYSLISRWFGGYLKNTLKKKDGTLTVSYDPFMVLPLSFPENNRPLTLAKMFKFFLSTEDLGTHAKTVSIQKAPQNLVVQLVRKDKDGKKIDDQVDFPLVWTVKTEEGPVQYELYALSLHRGSLDSGHYWADVKAAGEWYKANDRTITIKTSDEVIADENKSNAYLLFYSKK